jgi:hypothetical protein
MKAQTSLKRVLTVAAIACLLASAAPLAAAGKGKAAGPQIVPATEKYRGLTYSEWEAEWWQAMLQTPVVDDTHPLWVGGAVQGRANVVFLTGGAGFTGNITVNPGAAIFIPVVNVECSTIEEPPFHGDNEQELRDLANSYIDETTDLNASIDGVPVGNLASHRVESPLFSFVLPEHNAWGQPTWAGITAYSVDAGYYLLIKPLAKGLHVIHVEGTFPQFGPFVIDTAYTITVK